MTESREHPKTIQPYGFVRPMPARGGWRIKQQKSSPRPSEPIPHYAAPTVRSNRGSPQATNRSAGGMGSVGQHPWRMAQTGFPVHAAHPKNSLEIPLRPWRRPTMSWLIGICAVIAVLTAVPNGLKQGFGHRDPISAPTQPSTPLARDAPESNRPSPGLDPEIDRPAADSSVAQTPAGSPWAEDAAATIDPARTVRSSARPISAGLGMSPLPNTELVGAVVIDDTAAFHQDAVSGLARLEQPAFDTLAIEPGAAQSSDEVAEIISPTTSTQEMQRAETALQPLVNSAQPTLRPPSSGDAQGALLDNRLRRTEGPARAWAARTQPSAPSFEARPEVPSLRSSSRTTPQFRVQIAALRKEVDAHNAWDHFRSTLGPMLTGVTPYVERAKTDMGIFYRVQVGSLGTRDDAQDLCAEFKKHDVTCFVIAH